MSDCRIRIAVIIAVAAGLVLSAAHRSYASDTGAAIAGGIVGLAVGAALSKSHKHKEVIYYPGYAPPYPPGGYPAAWAQVFSPKPGVTCYPAQRACYDKRGAYNPKWSWKVYGN